MCKFELFKGVNGNYYFRLKAANGEKIAQSEGYATKQGALNGIAAVRRCVPTASTVDLT